ncbi:hypothetical protein NOI20_01775 [Rhodobacteraceae bacterium 10Alg 79]|uniref:Uncharacterized protein n=2 Tax=Rhodalgimonas zhirmunskyi TaxID=2964767 RepID=A0AAJ1U826_9RHOB|nr:hypothetical protein [Rhodoalgimonas zhirmunskyi]
MINPRHFIRMARWARRPPSRRMVITVLIVVGLAAVIVGIERTIGWPEWMQVAPGPIRPTR